MDIKRFFLVALAAWMVMGLLSIIWHLVLFSDLYNNGNCNIPIAALAYFMLSLLMTYAYPIFYKGGSPVIEGLKFGIFIGLIWILPLHILQLSIERVDLNMMLVDDPWHAIEQGIGGIVIALVYGRK